MKKSTILTATLALLVVLALPVAAQSAGQAAVEQTPNAAGVAPVQTPTLFEPAPIEQSKPVCQPGEHEFSTVFRFFYLEEDCLPLCDGYCQDNGGYLYAWSYDFRSLSCNCICCG